MRNKKSGVIVIDKPTNITSAQVVARVKKLFNVAKAGHTGTLDPFATGVLVCCVNNATRLANFFLHTNKKYMATLHLGIETDTQDLTGNVIRKCDAPEFSEKTLQSVFKQFEGGINQLPPVYSALKHNGVPLYKLAMRGTPVQKSARRIFIYSNKILKIDLPYIFFEVICSAGTYIRALCSDIGKVLGCGGHLKELRRLKSGNFTIDEAVTLTKLEKLASSGRASERIINMADALRDMPAHTVDENLINKIRHGVILEKKDFVFNDINNIDGLIKIIDANNNLISVINSQKTADRYDYCCVFHNNN